MRANCHKIATQTALESHRRRVREILAAALFAGALAGSVAGQDRIARQAPGSALPASAPAAREQTSNESPAPTAASLSKQGIALARAGRLNEAVDIYRKALALR